MCKHHEHRFHCTVKEIDTGRVHEVTVLAGGLAEAFAKLDGWAVDRLGAGTAVELGSHRMGYAHAAQAREHGAIIEGCDIPLAEFREADEVAFFRLIPCVMRVTGGELVETTMTLASPAAGWFVRRFAALPYEVHAPNGDVYDYDGAGWSLR